MVVFTKPEHTMSYFINHVTLTQHGMKNGIELWGERDVKAVKREMGQFHEHRMMSRIDLKAINTANKKNALAYLMLLKQKQSGIIKGKGCTDRRKQQVCYSKEETSTPTVMIELVFLTITIKARENCDMVTIKIPSAFLQVQIKYNPTI